MPTGKEWVFNLINAVIRNKATHIKNGVNRVMRAGIIIKGAKKHTNICSWGAQRRQKACAQPTSVAQHCLSTAKFLVNLAFFGKKRYELRVMLILSSGEWHVHHLGSFASTQPNVVKPCMMLSLGKKAKMLFICRWHINVLDTTMESIKQQAK